MTEWRGVEGMTEKRGGEREREKRGVEGMAETRRIAQGFCPPICLEGHAASAKYSCTIREMVKAGNERE